MTWGLEMSSEYGKVTIMCHLWQMTRTTTCDVYFSVTRILLLQMDQHTLAMKWRLIRIIVKWYSVLSFACCLWYICFVCFCDKLWHGVCWSSPLHYLIRFASKFWIVIISCDIESNTNAYPNIFIFPYLCCRV